MDESTIEFEFNRAIENANRLQEIADEIKSLSSSEIESAFETIRAGWEGESSVLFLSKGELLGQKVSEVADDVRKAADSIRRIAKKLYDAEKAVVEIAKSRSY